MRSWILFTIPEDYGEQREDKKMAYAAFKKKKEEKRNPSIKEKEETLTQVL